MDSRILELWGNILIQTARNQELLKTFSPGSSESREADWDFATWAEKWYEQLPSFQSLFLESANMDQVSEAGTQSLQAWQQGLDALYEQWKEFADLFGLVPKEEHERLARENEQLQERLRELEKTIQGLNALLEREGIFDPEHVSSEFSRLMNAQNEQFEVLMRFFEQSWKTGSDSENKETGSNETPG